MIRPVMVDGFYVVSAGGKPYRIRALLDQQVQTDFGRWLFQRAVSDLNDAKELYTEEEFKAERENLRKRSAKGAFHFASEAGQEALGTPAGVAFIIGALLTEAPENGILAFLLECPEVGTDILPQILSDSFRSLGQKKTTRGAPDG
jgi:hypothetical protein